MNILRHMRRRTPILRRTNKEKIPHVLIPQQLALTMGTIGDIEGTSWMCLLRHMRLRTPFFASYELGRIPHILRDGH